MPTFVLYLRVEAENVAEVKRAPGSAFCVDLQQAAGSEIRESVWIDPAEEHEVDGSRGTANFVMKWSKQDRKPCTVSIVDLKGKLKSAVDAQSREWTPIAAFECRGCDIIAFHPDDNFVATSTEGAQFTEVDLSDEWADYDDEHDLSVSILGLESKIESA